jgi:hypothetical protein
MNAHRTGRALFLTTVAVGLMSIMHLEAENVDKTKEVLETASRFQSAALRNDTQFLNQVFDEKITHFHPGEPYRFEGRERLVNELSTAAASHESPSFEMLDPKVQFAAPDVAILTYYISEHWTDKGGLRTANEKATEVYVRREKGWTMLHSHYSTAP